MARWADHFAALLEGKQVESVKASTIERHGDMQMLQLCNTLELSPEAVSDGIASEIWIAGGDKLANLLSELMRRIVANGTVPPQWKGGRLARLYKGKSNAADCNSHRGLSIADHAGCSHRCYSHRLRKYAHGTVRMRTRAWHDTRDAH